MAKIVIVDARGALSKRIAFSYNDPSGFLMDGADALKKSITLHFRQCARW